MSENEDDDRMDRAERIRRMREGSSRGDDRGDESESSGETNPGQAPENTGGEESHHEGGDAEANNSSEQDAHEDGGASPDRDEPDDDDTTDLGPADDEWVSGADKMKADEDDEDRDPADAVPETADLDTENEVSTEADEEGDISAPLPDSDQLEDALQGEKDSETETVAPDEVAGADTSEASDALEEEVYEEETRVLEFQLGDEYYCLDIEYIEEIVKEETITRVPNTPDFVEGVVDLRGQITTILNPKVTIEKEDTTPGDLIVVFDSGSFEDQGHVGWVVDDVRQVSPITDTQVSDPPVDESYVNGVIDRGDDDQFVIWTSPEMAMEEAE